MGTSQYKSRGDEIRGWLHPLILQGCYRDVGV
jgi:hypothetical protein